MLSPGGNSLINPEKLPVRQISDSESLAALCRRWGGKVAVALDTEFIRERTFFPILGLIQAADDEGIYLIDPLADMDFAPFTAFLGDESVIKILHSCGEDLDAFGHFSGVLPTPVFDTQIAVAYCGMDTQMGYQRIVQSLYGISLEKHETRSDWLQRPLSKSQLAYAEEDVRYLLMMYSDLKQRLVKNKRLDWVEEECRSLLCHGRTSDAAHYYLKFRNASHFTYPQQRLLQKLCMWREAEARRCDRPRGFILSESSLLPIAEALPASKDELRQVQGLGKNSIGRYGDIILTLVSEVKAEPTEESFAFIPKPLRKDCKPLQDALKKAAVLKAKELHLKPELLLRRKNLDKIVQKLIHPHDSDWKSVLSDWRLPILEPVINREIRNFETLIASIKKARK